MKKVFLGFLFLFINCNISLGSITINFLPEFVGYILLIIALKELNVQNKNFDKAKPIVGIMCVFSVVFFFINLFNVFSSNLAMIGFVFSAFLVLGALYVTYYIVLGIIDIEMETQVDLAGDKLYVRWKDNAFVQVASFVCLFIPFVNLLAMLVSIFTAFMLVFAAYKTSVLYNTANM